MSLAPFIPTHRLHTQGGDTVEVMLVDGAAYTREEWNAGAPADYERDPEAGWMFQGKPFAGTVDRLRRPRP